MIMNINQFKVMGDTGNAILEYLSLYCRLCDCREYEKDLMNVSMEIFEATDVTENCL